MNYQEFLTTVEARMRTMFGEDVSILIQKFQKNNGVCLDGLLILSPQSNMTPTIYLMPYYHRYLDGISLIDICDDIYHTYMAHLPNIDFDISAFTDFSLAQNNIILRLINYERNQKLLETVPHKRFLDLALVFCCLLDNCENELGSILIHTEHLQFWNIDCESLYELALKNTPRLLPASFMSMQQLIKNLPEFADTGIVYEEIPMYILTNSRRTNGACSILYPNILSPLAEELSCNLYILPSSIHETIIIPANYIDDPNHLEEMVQQVNDTQLADDELLSYHIYLYDKEHQNICMYVSEPSAHYS